MAQRTELHSFAASPDLVIFMALSVSRIFLVPRELFLGAISVVSASPAKAVRHKSPRGDHDDSFGIEPSRLHHLHTTAARRIGDAARLRGAAIQRGGGKQRRCRADRYPIDHRVPASNRRVHARSHTFSASGRHRPACNRRAGADDRRLDHRRRHAAGHAIQRAD